MTERSGTGGRRGRNGRLPHGESGGIFLQDVTTALFVTERERFLSPVELRIVLLEPRHPENDVEAAELSGDEVDRIGVGADADGGLGQEATRLGADPSAKQTVSGCPERARPCLAAKADETKLPVAPQSTSTTAG